MKLIINTDGSALIEIIDDGKLVRIIEIPATLFCDARERAAGIARSYGLAGYTEQRFVQV